MANIRILTLEEKEKIASLKLAKKCYQSVENTIENEIAHLFRNKEYEMVAKKEIELRRIREKISGVDAQLFNYIEFIED